MEATFVPDVGVVKPRSKDGFSRCLLRGFLLCHVIYRNLL